MKYFDNLSEALKLKIRLMCLSVLFLMGTTFVSCFAVFIVALVAPETAKTLDIESLIIGSVFGQVTILVSISVFGALQKTKTPPEVEPVKEIELKDLDDVEG